MNFRHVNKKTWLHVLGDHNGESGSSYLPTHNHAMKTSSFFLYFNFFNTFFVVHENEDAILPAHQQCQEKFLQSH